MTLPGAMLVGISTPHKKPGLLFERYKKALGAEYGACRNLDVEAFVGPEVAAACVPAAGMRGFARQFTTIGMVDWPLLTEIDPRAGM